MQIIHSLQGMLWLWRHSSLATLLIRACGVSTRLRLAFGVDFTYRATSSNDLLSASGRGS